MRTATCLFFLLTLLSCQKSVTDPDLVAWWSFDDATLSSAPDKSVHSLNTVNKGTVPVEGKYGRALQFDGKSVLQVDYQPILDEFQNGITVMAWIKKDTASHWNTIVSREIGSGWSEYMGLAIYKNQALFSIDQDGTKYMNITDAGIIQPDVWYHLAGTFDNNALKIYVNGKLIKSAISKGHIMFSDKNPLLIGGNSNNQNQSLVDCFKGTIDEVRIYKRALTLDEINKLIK
jgi:hypothetical protein